MEKTERAVNITQQAFDSQPVYDLFVSYRRSDATAHAIALRDWLLDYRIPGSLHTPAHQRPLKIFLDEINIRASNDYFNEEILPALRVSRNFLILLSPAATQPDSPSKPNWLQRELTAYRNPDNPRRDRVFVGITQGDLMQSLPGGLDQELPRIERLEMQGLVGWNRWWPTRRARVESELLPLVATLREISADQMPVLRREEQRLAASRLTNLLLLAVTVIAAISIALAWALVSQIDATKSGFDAKYAQVEAKKNAANALARLADEARRSGDVLGATRLLTEAQMLAWTSRVQVSTLSVTPPRSIFQLIVPGEARPVAFSPADQLALGGYDGSIKLFDPAGQKTKVIRAPDGIPIVDLSYSADGDLYIVARAPADAAWNVPSLPGTLSQSRLERISASGQAVPVNALPSGAHVNAASVSSDGKVLLVGADDGVWFLDQSTAGWVQLERRADGALARPIASVAVSPGKQFAAGSTIDGNIFVWDLPAGKLIRRWIAPRDDGTFPYNPFKLVFSKTDSALTFGSFDGVVHRWQFAREAEPQVLTGPHQQALTVVARSVAEGVLATGGWDAKAAIGHSALDRFETVRVGYEGLRAGVMGLAVSSDGKWVATTEAIPKHVGGTDPGRWMYGKTRLWSVRPAESITQLPMRSPLQRLAFDAQGQLLAAEGARSMRLKREGAKAIEVDSPIKVWDPLTMSQRSGGFVPRLNVDDREVYYGDFSSVRFDENPETSLASSLVYSPSGRRGARLVADVHQTDSVLVNPRIQLFDTRAGKLLIERGVNLPTVRAFGPVEFVDETQVFASLVAAPGIQGSRPGSHVWLWRTTEDRLDPIVELKNRRIFDLTVSAAKQRIAVSDDNRMVAVFDFSGKALWQVEESRLANAPAVLAFSPLGDRLFAAASAQMHSWASDRGWQETVGSVDIMFRPSAIESDPTGRIVVVADISGRLRFLDGQSLQEISTTDLGVGALLSVSISPDGQRLAALGTSGSSVRGGSLPIPVQHAERVSRMTIQRGGLFRISEQREIDLLARHPATPPISAPDKAAIEFYQLLGQSAVSYDRPEHWLDWLLATDPVRFSPAMERWLNKYPNHALSRNPLQWSVAFPGVTARETR